MADDEPEKIEHAAKLKTWEDESARVALLGLRIKTLESQRDGAFIQGMERARDIVSRSRFAVGPLNYPCDAVAQAVQCVIDEYKAESARKAGS